MIDFMKQLLWAWLSCPTKSAAKIVEQDTELILLFATSYNISFMNT